MLKPRVSWQDLSARSLLRKHLLLLAWVYFLCAGFAHSADIPPQLTCYSTPFEPYVIKKETDKGHEIVGVDVEIVQLVGRELGIAIDFEMMPWKRLEHEVKNGNVDCVAAYFRTLDREPFMLFTHVPLHITAYTLFVGKNSPAYAPLEQIRNWSIAVNRGFKTTPELELAVSQNRVELVELNSTRQGFDMLALGRVNAVLTNLHVGRYLTKQHYDGAFHPMKPSLSATPAYLVFARKTALEPLVPLFDEALMNVMIDGRYMEVFDRYMGASTPRK